MKFQIFRTSVHAYQAMRHSFAELKMDIELLRGLVYGVLEGLDNGDADVIEQA
ncbi:MAG: hypothetical protein IJ237_01875 [Oscillospiraceae bacterium]|nr:hypothetical protein [Oscillospiraceae bacterium]